MKKRFFIMIYSQDGESALPMVEGDGNDVKFFDSKEDARIAGSEQICAQAFGFEIFEMGQGES